MTKKYCYSRFVRQFISSDDWGHRGYVYEDAEKTVLSTETVPRHAKSKEHINKSLARKSTSHQIKRDTEWEGTLARKYFASYFSTPEEKQQYYALKGDSAKIEFNNNIIRQINRRVRQAAKEEDREYDRDYLSIAQIKALIDNGKCRYRTSRSHCIETHLQAALDKDKEFYLYYTSNPKSPWNMPCIDIDIHHDTTDLADSTPKCNR